MMSSNHVEAPSRDVAVSLVAGCKQNRSSITIDIMRETKVQINCNVLIIMGNTAYQYSKLGVIGKKVKMTHHKILHQKLVHCIVFMLLPLTLCMFCCLHSFCVYS